MLKRILAFALQQRLLAIALAMLIAGGGLWLALRLPIDAVSECHERPGSDQHELPGALASRGGSGRHDPDRGDDVGPAERHGSPLALEVRPLCR